MGRRELRDELQLRERNLCEDPPLGYIRLGTQKRVPRIIKGRVVMVTETHYTLRRSAESFE